MCLSKLDNHRGLGIIGGKRIERGSDLGLEILDIYELYKNGDPKFLARLNELINTTETAKQPLRIEHDGVSSPKEPGRKKRKLKWRSEDDCADNLRKRRVTWSSRWTRGPFLESLDRDQFTLGCEAWGNKAKEIIVLKLNTFLFVLFPQALMVILDFTFILPYTKFYN